MTIYEQLRQEIIKYVPEKSEYTLDDILSAIRGRKVGSADVLIDCYGMAWDFYSGVPLEGEYEEPTYSIVGLHWHWVFGKFLSAQPKTTQKEILKILK